MPNNYFKFKQFSIQQENAAMKVGTDGVLLGAWADCTEATTILDIGTGTGLIALMLAQRCNALIDAIDIDDKAIQDAKINIDQSIWNRRINLFHTAIQKFKTAVKYDLIVTNPPFFSQSHKAQTESRTKARHDDSLSIDDLFNAVYQLLDVKGKFCAVVPADNYENYITQARKYNLNCNKVLWIKPTPSKLVKRALIEFSFEGTTCNEAYLIVEDKGRHQYSDQYKLLTKDFYLKF